MKSLKFGLSVAVLTITAGSGISAQDAPLVPRPAKVLTVTTQTQSLRVQYPAIVYPSQETELSFRVPGQVTHLAVRAADRVTAGDEIAQLDTRDFENDVTQLESQRDQSQQQLIALKAGARPEDILALEASLGSAQAKFKQAEDQAARTRTLQERGVVAQAQLDEEIARMRVAEADVKFATEQLAIGNAGGRPEDIAAAEAALRGLEAQIDNARDNLSDATLRAPFDGVIARRHIDNFTNISAGDNIVLLQKLSTVDMVFDIPGADVLRWTARDSSSITVVVELSGASTALTATELVEFSTQADPGTQTYQARVSVKIPEGIKVLPGMAGRVRIQTDQAGVKFPFVPLTALASASDGAPFVWVVDADNAISARPVTPGAIDDGLVTITQGLNGGERIVTAGVSRLNEGTVIRPIAAVGE